MIEMKNGIIYFILLIIGIYIATIYVNKKTIDEYENISERDKNLNNIRGLIWGSYIVVTTITIYLLVKLYSKTGFYYNKFMFIITIIILLVNTGLTIHEEYILKDLLSKINNDHQLNNIYIISTIMVVINIISLIGLMYTNEESKIYRPKYETIQYQYTQDGGIIAPSLLRTNKTNIEPTKNIVYENVFQNKPQSYIAPSLLPPKRTIQKKDKIDRILKSKRNVNQAVSSKSPKSNKASNKQTNDVYVNPLLL